MEAILPLGVGSIATSQITTIPSEYIIKFDLAITLITRSLIDISFPPIGSVSLWIWHIDEWYADIAAH
jgi:hypothetical protein